MSVPMAVSALDTTTTVYACINPGETWVSLSIDAFAGNDGAGHWAMYNGNNVLATGITYDPASNGMWQIATTAADPGKMTHGTDTLANSLEVYNQFTSLYTPVSSDAKIDDGWYAETDDTLNIRQTVDITTDKVLASGEFYSIVEQLTITNNLLGTSYCTPT